jgi:hypothetical protein
VVIRSSRSGEIERLVADLGGPATKREAAIARLRIIGPRAVDRVAALAVAPGATAVTRTAALKALEGNDDDRALRAAAAAIGDPDAPVAIAALGVLRGRLTGESGTEILDLISGVALDAERPRDVRLAALDALSELPRHVVQPLLQHAGLHEPSPAGSPVTPGPFEEPAAATEWLAANPGAPLSVLHDLVLELRERERREPSARGRQRWVLARGAAHAALARRGSRVALYDLRESFDAAQEPLPLDFLAAATILGDTATLEPLARAWAAAAPVEKWWRERLRDAADEIVKREKLTKRSAVVKRIAGRYPGFI